MGVGSSAVLYGDPSGGDNVQFLSPLLLISALYRGGSDTANTLDEDPDGNQAAVSGNGIRDDDCRGDKRVDASTPSAATNVDVKACPSAGQQSSLYMIALPPLTLITFGVD